MITVILKAMNKNSEELSQRERDERSQYLADLLSAEIRADIKESRQFRREMREQSQRSSERLDRFIEEGRQQRERMDERQWDRECQERQEKWDRERQERQRQHDRELREHRERMERMGYVQGEIAEELFYRNLASLLSDYGISRGDVYRNAHVPGIRQYDLLAINGALGFVFEVKNKLRLDDIERFCNVQLTDFKKAFPMYSEHKIYGGIGALVVRDDLQRRAEKKGLFVLTQGQDDCAHLHKPKKPWVI